MTRVIASIALPIVAAILTGLAFLAVALLPMVVLLEWAA